jgi:hypothetical protein
MWEGWNRLDAVSFAQGPQGHVWQENVQLRPAARKEH